MSDQTENGDVRATDYHVEIAVAVFLQSLVDQSDIRELADKVLAITGSGSEILHQPLPENDPIQRQPDITKARELLGWQPTVRLDDGLM